MPQRGALKASNLALSNIHIDPRFPTPNGSHVRIPRHAEAPNVLLVKKGVTAGVDHFVGGLQGGVNEWMRPGGDGPVQGFTNGLLSGAEGQTYSTPRRVAGETEKGRQLEQEARSADALRRKPKRGNILVFSVLGLAVVVTIGIVGGGQLFKAYDRSHQIEETCEVRKAEASSGGSTSSRGVGTLFDQVEVDTKDCGPLVLRRGVTEQNKQEIADELSSAGRVQFRIGAGSFKWRDVLHTFRTPVIVQSYVAHE